MTKLIEVNCNPARQDRAAGKGARVQQKEKISLGAGMLRVQGAEHEPPNLTPGQQSREYTYGNSEAIPFGPGRGSERPMQGLLRDRRRVAVGIDRPASWN